MKKLNLFLLSALILAASCKKDHSDPIPVYTVPTTYNFTNFNDSNVLKLLAMADQIGAKINTASNANTVVSAQDLKDMFNNTGNKFADTALKLNASGLKLSSWVAPAAVTDLNNYFDSIALASQSNTSANGQPGRAVSKGNKKYALSANGVFYYQVVRKTFNGGLCAYSITNRYIKDSIAGANNTTVTTGSGTAQEHYWDEAFGFWAVPVDFPTNITGLRYFSSYSNQVDAGLGSNKTIMDAFLKGRAAISAKDTKTRDAQSTILVTTFEQLTAASVVQEMKETDQNIDAGDAVAAMGTMGEALGFARDLKYYAYNRKITDAQITQLLTLFDSSNPTNPNLYNFINTTQTTAQLKAKTDAIRQFIGQVYGFTATQLAAQ
ncbi:MAG: DUF4856 domain-containing protein [Bacteroidetes bacterium]|nr:DUF4856 domain-containing protein [Bacteroidota bacterium]